MEYYFKHQLFIVLSLFSFVAGCQSERELEYGYNNLNQLRVAILPDQNKTAMRHQYEPLLDYLSKTTKLETTLILPSSYEDLLNLFSQKKVDLVLFGGATYVKAHRLYGAMPLVMRDIDKHYRSIFLVKADSGMNNLADLKGKALAFGSRLSTSGHYMPRYFLKEKNIDAEHYFSDIKYSGAHDKTAEWVRDGIVDVGVAHSGVISGMYNDGRLKIGSIKIIWETPTFPDYVWTVQGKLASIDKIMIRNAFMLLSLREPNQKKILDSLGGGFYLDAHHETFIDLGSIVND